VATVTVTVGIPTFNRARLLAQTIESVLSQTFTGFRLVISDNASTDATPELVRSFDDDRIEYLRSERNVGAIANQNRLIALADTEFLVLLPDDDVLYPGHLGECVELLQRFDTLGLAHTAFDLIDAESRVFGRMRPLPSRSPTVVEPHRRALNRLMVSSWPVCFASVMYRTKAIVDAGGLREQDGQFGDLQLWMRIALHWDFGYVARPLTGFRAHAESASSSVGSHEGAQADERELVLLHAQMRFERRMSFLEDASIEPRRAASLRARARLQLLVEEASEGLATREIASRLSDLVIGHPSIMSRPALWRLIAAQLGGRRGRALLRSLTVARSEGASAPSLPTGSP
jgi:hypothetical protein